MKIVYLANYIECKIINQRNNKYMFVQSAKNKIDSIVEAMSITNEVTILSSGYVKNKSFKKFRSIVTRLNKSILIYASIWDIPLINWISSIISSIYIIIKINKRSKIHCIIFYNYRPENAIPAFCAKLFLHIPIVLEYEDGYFADNDIKKITKYSINFLEFFISRFISGAILVNKNLKERLHMENFCVCLGTYKEKKLYKFNDNNDKKEELVIMYSGRYDYERGIEVFLQSLRQIKYNVKIKLAGYGPLNEYVEVQIINIQQENSNVKIHKFEYLEKSQLDFELLTSDILVNPQRIESSFSKYSFPSKLMEYMNFGKIIISSDIGELDDVIVKYYNDNSMELSDKINEVIQNYDKYRIYEQRALDFIKNNCSIKTVNKDIDSVLKKIYK